MPRKAFKRLTKERGGRNLKRSETNDEYVFCESVRNLQGPRASVSGCSSILVCCATGLRWSASQRDHLSDNCDLSNSRHAAIHGHSEREHEHGSYLAGQWGKWRQLDRGPGFNNDSWHFERGTLSRSICRAESGYGFGYSGFSSRPNQVRFGHGHAASAIKIGRNFFCVNNRQPC